MASSFGIFFVLVLVIVVVVMLAVVLKMLEVVRAMIMATSTGNNGRNLTVTISRVRLSNNNAPRNAKQHSFSDEVNGRVKACIYKTNMLPTSQ